jgi:hypothetical protein
MLASAKRCMGSDVTIVWHAGGSGVERNETYRRRDVA